jgi:bacteriocin-like protein
MKKISLRGISEILSEKELKNVVGGVEKQTYQNEPEEPETVGEAACKGKLPNSPCTISWSGGTVTYLCWIDKNNKMHCGNY